MLTCDVTDDASVQANSLDRRPLAQGHLNLRYSVHRERARRNRKPIAFTQVVRF